LSKDELCELAETVSVRVEKWLRKRGLDRDDQDFDSNETRVFFFDEMLAQWAAGRGTFQKVKDCHHDAQAGRSETNPRPPPCDGAVTLCGFNLHASVRIAAADDRWSSNAVDKCMHSPVSIVCACSPMAAIATASRGLVVVHLACES